MSEPLAVKASAGAVVGRDDRIRGTAFWVTPSIAITCEHVVRSLARDEIRIAPAVGGIEPVPVKGVEVDVAADLALLRTDPVSAAIQLLDLSVSWREGRMVVSHGYPCDKSRKIFPTGNALDPPGIIAGSEDVAWRESTNELLVISQATPTDGQSGGPAVDTETGRVVGVIRLVFEGDDMVSTYAIPTGELVGLWGELEQRVISDVREGPVSPDQWIPPVGLRPRRDPIESDSDDRLAERGKELEQIAQALKAESTAAILADAPHAKALEAPEPVRATLHGSAGIGKSALALEYAYQHLSTYSAVWWVNASSPATITASFTRFAQALHLDTQDLDEQAIRDRIIDHLNRRRDWLVIFDNAESREEVEGWLPPIGHGQVLITSRNPSGWRQPIRIGRLSDDAIRDWLIAATTSGTAPQDKTTAAATELAAEFDGLALAAAQTISYHQRTGSSLERYLSLYRQAQGEVLGAEETPIDYPQSIAATISIAVDALFKAGEQAAVRLLDLIAYLAPDSIPIRLFTPEVFGDDSPLIVDTAIRGLRQMGLIETTGDDFAVHRLTQSVVRHRHQQTP